MKKNLSLVILLLAGLATCFQGSTATAQNKPSAKVAALLEETGYSYSKAADTVWSIQFEGKSLPNFNVIASAPKDVLVLFTVVAKKDTLKLTPDAMQKLLQLNSRLDRVKIGIDEDGDLFVRTDLSVRVLDAREMKENIEQVAAATDVVYAAVRSSIVGAK